MPETLFAGSPPALLALLGFFCFLAGILRGFNGFGSALLSVPAISFLLDPAQAVVVATLTEIPIVLLLLPTIARHASAKTTLPMIAAFVIFVPVGALTLVSIDPTPMKIALCLFILAMLAILVKQDHIAAFLNPKTLVLAGILGGFSQGLTAVASPIFATAMIARGEDATTTRANIIALAAALIALSIISFGTLGLLTWPALASAGFIVVPITLGVFCGQKLFDRASHLNLRPVFLALVVITTLSTLIQTLI